LEFSFFSFYFNLSESFWIFWTLWESFGIFWNLLESFGLFWNILESFGIFWNLLLESFVGIFWNLWKSLGIFPNLSESFRIFPNLLESFGIFWNLLESFGIFRNLSKFFGTFQNLGIFLNLLEMQSSSLYVIYAKTFFISLIFGVDTFSTRIHIPYIPMLLISRIFPLIFSLSISFGIFNDSAQWYISCPSVMLFISKHLFLLCTCLFIHRLEYFSNFERIFDLEFTIACLQKLSTSQYF